MLSQIWMDSKRKARCIPARPWLYWARSSLGTLMTCFQILGECWRCRVRTHWSEGKSIPASIQGIHKKDVHCHDEPCVDRYFHLLVSFGLVAHVLTSANRLTSQALQCALHNLKLCLQRDWWSEHAVAASFFTFPICFNPHYGRFCSAAPRCYERNPVCGFRSRLEDAPLP